MTDYRIDGFFAPDKMSDGIEALIERLDEYGNGHEAPVSRNVARDAAAALRSLYVKSIEQDRAEQDREDAEAEEHALWEDLE